MLPGLAENIVKLHSSAVSSFCKIVQNNGLLTGFTGLSKAINICNSLNTMSSQQVLSPLCSVLEGFEMSNIKSKYNNSNNRSRDLIQFKHYNKIKEHQVS
jgi:hypothetical protein